MKNEDHENEDRSLKTPENDKEDAEVFLYLFRKIKDSRLIFFWKKGQ